MTDFAAVIPQLPTLLVYGLGAVALMAIGVIFVLLLEALCMLGLSIHYAESVRRESRPKTAVLALVAAICGAGVAPLAAQGAGQQVRTVEPRLTRLFGSDSLQVDLPVLSPDGRWIVFGSYEAEIDNLWVVPAAGGEPVRLTTGRYADDRAVFFPGGDRIAFRSDRPSSPGNPQRYVMVMPFDSRTGRASGPLRQVSLEPTSGSFAVSPDGEGIAYGARQDTAVKVMVIPSSGGTARELARFPGPWGPANLAWSADGANVYFTLRHAGRDLRSFMRVPAAGGRTEELGTATWTARAMNGSRGLVLLRGASQMPSQEQVYEIATFEGRSVARFTVPRNMEVWNFTPDGRGLLAVRNDIVAPIRVVPLAGGPARQLTEAREYDWPIGWSQDGSRLYVQTQANGHGAVLDIPVNGGPAAQWLIPTFARGLWTISPDGRYLRYGVIDSSQSGDLASLVIRRLSDGQTRVVTRALHSAMMQPSASGPGGGWWRNGDEFLYLERRGDQLELKSTPPEGPARLLRRFPMSLAVRTGFGVHGNRIAYSEKRGDSIAVLVAEGQSGRPRLLATVAGAPAGAVGVGPVWSHDGRWLAFDFYPPGDGSRYSVLLLGVGPDGAVAAAPRVLEAGPQWGWQIEWLPDDRAFTVFGMTGQANQTHVFLVSLREGERPVALTRDDPSTRWGYELSPDGRYVAYPAEISRGSSIWRLDLGDVLAEGRRGTRR